MAQQDPVFSWPVFDLCGPLLCAFISMSLIVVRLHELSDLGMFQLSLTHHRDTCSSKGKEAGS